MAKEDSEKKNVDIALQSVEVEKKKKKDFRKEGNIKELQFALKICVKYMKHGSSFCIMFSLF